MYSFTTDRLIIRPLQQKDKEHYCQLYTDQFVMEHIAEPLSQQQAQEAFASTLKAMSRQEPSYLAWAILSLKEQHWLGLAGLQWQLMEGLAAEAGVMLGAQQGGQGYAKEALSPVLSYGFKQFCFQFIDIRCSASNRAMEKVAKALDFQFLGQSPQQSPINAAKERPMAESTYRMESKSWETRLSNRI